MAELQEVSGGGIRDIRQVDPEGFTLVTTDDRIYRIALPPGVVGPQGPKGDKGERGIQGEMGSPGADGRDGRDGLNGNDGRDGVSVTLAQVLRNGDLALMLSNGDVINAGKVVGPQGAQGLPGRPGVPGPAGEDGSQIFLVAGPPDNATGQSGDIAIDTRAWKLYQKSSLGWGSGNDMLPNSKTLDQAVRSFNGVGGGGRAPRFFGMGAPSAGISGGGGGTGTLQPILQNDQPLPANAWTPVAFDPDGDAMIVDLWAASPNGTVFIEVAASKGLAADTGYSVVYEIQIGTNPPNLTFRASVSGANQLQLEVNSDTALTTLRGRQMLI